MDFLKAISDAAYDSAANREQLIGYTNGMIIVALLFFIYWCLIRDMRRRKKLEFPRFCDDCLFLVIVRSGLCRKKCKYHPDNKDSARNSFYLKKTS